MKIKTGLYAFVEEVTNRIVDVPDAEWDSAKIIENRLELVYKYGQNDFQPQQIPSLSDGDVVFLDGDIWIVAMCGFRKLSLSQFNEYAGTHRDFRWKKRFEMKIA